MTASGQAVSDRWTVGGRKTGINPGDRAFAYRYHDHRGLVASGTFSSDVYHDQHWDGSGRVANYADVSWNVVLHYDDCLPTEELNAAVPEMHWSHLQGSGIEVKPEALASLASLWEHHASEILFRSADEPCGAGSQGFPEGALSRVEVNRYERDPRARRACLQRWGYRCAVCNFSFEERYGPLGRAYIHVHHTLELSRVPQGYQVDPVKDLRPLCPNCHAMIHYGPGPALTIEDLKRQLVTDWRPA
jgi:5-methylcytosine-specific restriction protein A